MNEKIMMTIIEALAKALEQEKTMREYFERRARELEEKEGHENGQL